MICFGKAAIRAMMLSTVAIAATPSIAQTAGQNDAGSEAPGAEIIVTGTRVSGVRADESPQPVQVIGAETLTSVGDPSLRKALALSIPSLQAQALGGNEAGLNMALRLRGLNPNHTLVLVNGKRRHTTASLAVSAGAFQGGASADFNFLPVDAIERVELLQNGAAAQYGSDAIAGVINVILKSARSGGALTTSAGHYFDQGGERFQLSANAGFNLSDKGWFNITAEHRFQGSSNRSGIDSRVVGAANIARYPSVVNFPGYPNVNVSKGDARLSVQNLLYDAGVELGDVTLYSYGSYGRKRGQYTQTYRLPTVAPTVFPNGFNPFLAISERDAELGLGIRGGGDGFTWDLSSRYGQDRAKYYTKNSINQSLLADAGSTQTDFYDGSFKITSWNNQLDATKNVDLGWAKPLTIAFGGQARFESYTISAGEPASYYKTGAQSFAGFQPASAGRNSRRNYAGYVELAGSPVAELQLSAAGRFEHFSEFGDTVVGKVTARYDFTPGFALRGTVSTGFRAPTLPEEYYTAIAVGPTSGTVQLAPNGPGAKLLGLPNLRPEKSENLSAGAVLRIGDDFFATLDAYRIDIRDRIVGTGTVFCAGPSATTPTSPAVCAAIAAAGVTFDPGVTQRGAALFTNQVDTRTHGADLVISYRQDLNTLGKVHWTLAGTYNTTHIRRTAPNPALFPPNVVLLNENARSILETQSPKFQANLMTDWQVGRLGINLRNTLYGPSSELRSFNGRDFFETKVTAKLIVDLNVSYRLTDRLEVSAGADNLLNTYPNGVNPVLLEQFRVGNSDGTSRIYPDFSPIGINGGYYYGRLRFRL